jgi:hypothetical protein
MATPPDFFASFPPGVRSLWGMDVGGFNYAEKAYCAWFDAAGRIQGDAVRFLRHRLEKDQAAFAELGKCQTAVDAFNVQFAYARDTFADFVSEGQKIAAMIGDVARENIPSALVGEFSAEPKRTLRKVGAHAATH